MIISITGNIGSGKSTAAKQLSEKLNIPWYSMGDMRGKMAEERGMSLQEFNKLGESENFTDKEVDDYQAKLGKTETDFVIDGKVSWNFIPNSFKVFLKVSKEVGAKRVLSSSKKGERTDEIFKSIQEAKLANNTRAESDQKRYKKYYNIDYLNMENYDLVIDTSNLSEEEALKKILDSLPID
jgi:CMP/dCMP kinase